MYFSEKHSTATFIWRLSRTKTVQRFFVGTTYLKDNAFCVARLRGTRAGCTTECVLSKLHHYATKHHTATLKFAWNT